MTPPARRERTARDTQTAEHRPRKLERDRPSTMHGMRDRSRVRMAWYRFVQLVTGTAWCALAGLRATGRETIPTTGGALLVANHLSHLDVFVLGQLQPRPLNYVARSTLFFPPLGALIRSVGGFPIQHDGLGAQGVKETLRRLRNGSLVVLFPEGARSFDGDLGPLKPGISALASRTRVPIVPIGIAGTFEALPRGSPWPTPHAVRIHFGTPILPAEYEGLGPDALSALIRDRMLDARRVASEKLARDLHSAASSTSPATSTRSRSEARGSLIEIFDWTIRAG